MLRTRLLTVPAQWTPERYAATVGRTSPTCAGGFVLPARRVQRAMFATLASLLLLLAGGPPPPAWAAQDVLQQASVDPALTEWLAGRVPPARSSRTWTPLGVVPDLSGSSLDEARMKAARAQLRVETVGPPAGYVYYQVPRPDRKLPAGGIIRVQLLPATRTEVRRVAQAVRVARPPARPDFDRLDPREKRPHDELRERVDRAVQTLEPGHLSYRPPDSMREGEVQRLTVRVQRAGTTGAWSLPGEGPVVKKELEVGTPMRAKLFGDGFEVDPADAMTQVLSSTRPTDWTWSVRPRSTGNKELRLELAVLLDIGTETPVTPTREYVEVIEVKVHPITTTVRLARGATGVLSAAGVSVAVILAAMWTRISRRNGDDRKTSTARPRSRVATRIIKRRRGVRR